MPKILDFFDGVESATAPIVGDIEASSLTKYANDAAYEADNTNAPEAGDIYYNTTLDQIKYYDADELVWKTLHDPDDLQDDIDDKIPLAQKGAANGVVPLNASTLIDSTYLPSYVDDVLEYANLAAFPITGETGKIYVAIDTAKTYRWTGSIYVEVSASDVTSVNGDVGVVTVDAINELTGDVTAGPATQSESKVATIANDVVTNAKAANMAAWTIKARNDVASGDPQDVALADLTEELSPAAGDYLLGHSPTGELRKFDVGNLPSGGSSFPSYTAQSTTYLALLTDDVIVCSGSSWTLSLPTAVGNTGKTYQIKHNGTNFTQVYTINPNGAETLNGVSVYRLRTFGETVKIISDGANWILIDHYSNASAQYTPTVTGFGTVTTDRYFWTRNGKMLEVFGYLVTGTVAASIASISLPSSLTIDTSLLDNVNTTANPGSLVGHYSFQTALSSGYMVTASGTNANLIYFGLSHDTATPLTPQLGNAVAATADNGSFHFRVPISEFENE